MRLRPTRPSAPSAEPRSSHMGRKRARCKPSGAKTSNWNAPTASARPAGRRFFPLDDELELLPGQLTPALYECLVEMGAEHSFEKARKWLKRYLRVNVSEPTARRDTQDAGAAWVALETAAAEEIERTQPEAPAGAAMAVIQVDGTTVPLVGGQWVEVKTLVVGTAGAPEKDGDEQVVKTQNLSYFSRYAEADCFERLALVEIHRRGVENAGRVGAIVDGALWCQGFLDYHCPEAVRILDFPHAGGYVHDIGEAVWGPEGPELPAWTALQLHRLKHEGAPSLLPNLHICAATQALQGAPAELAQTALDYLDAREAQMQYPAFQAQGWPIGSGAVESSHWTVVASRLQGAGMHWAPAHVDPMLALRNVICSEYWDMAWPQIEAHLRKQAWGARVARREQRRAATAPPPPATPTPKPKRRGKSGRKRAGTPPHPPGPWVPAPDHPWRRSYKTIPSKV